MAEKNGLTVAAGTGLPDGHCMRSVSACRRAHGASPALIFFCVFSYAKSMQLYSRGRSSVNTGGPYRLVSRGGFSTSRAEMNILRG